VRKLASIAFILLFLLLSGGVQILVHTCGDETSVEMMPSSARDPCGCSDESPDSRCCTVELKSFQLDAMQQAMATLLLKVETVAVVEVPSSLNLMLEPSVIQVTSVTPSPPPSVSSTILNRTFLV